MYRVAKKTTKKTENYCLNCKYHDLKRELHDNLGMIIECNAPNACIKGEFNSKDFYCMEYRVLNEMNASEKENIRQEMMEDYMKKSFREYANKYYPKAKAKEMIKEFNDNLKYKRFV